jgi:nicotinamidase-related amidase
MSDQDLHDDYKGAGFSGRLGFGGRPALLVIDFAKAYLDRSSPLYAGVEGTLESTCRVLQAARSAGIPRIFTRVRYEQGALDGGIFYRKVPALRVFDATCPLGELADELQPQPDELVVTKQYASAFFGTSLASTLTAGGVDSVVVTGVTTSGCVRATGVDAMQHGFVPIIVEEAVGDRDERPHRANLFDLGAKYADVVHEDEVLEHLAGLPR